MSDSDLLATIDNKTTVLGVNNDEISEYVLENIRANYKKPPRIDGRPLLNKEQFTKEFAPPIGLFNLGNNSLYLREAPKEEEEDEDIIIKNHATVIDGKLVFTEEDQGKVNAEEEEYAYNIALKNDIPYLIYMKIREFGRLTENELASMYGALDRRMLAIIIKDMLHKRFLKKIKEKDQNMVFKDIKGFKDIQEYMNSCLVETEIVTFEIVSASERRQVLT